MRKHLFATAFVLGLIVVVAGAASANPWPDWNATTGGLGFSVSPVQTSTGWDYTVTVDPADANPEWGIKAFVVYYDGIDPANQQAQGWHGYDGGNTAGWTDTNGGWELNKYPGPSDTTAALGWQGTGPSSYVMSGSSAVFHAVNLPAGFADFSQHFVVHAANPETGVTYWSNSEGPRPPKETPEPATLALLTVGLGAVTGVIRRRKSS